MFEICLIVAYAKPMPVDKIKIKEYLVEFII
jgi:hypothetical protein